MKKEIDEIIKICEEWKILTVNGDKVSVTDKFLAQRFIASIMLKMKHKNLKEEKDISIGINLLTAIQMCKVLKEKQLDLIVELLEKIAPIPEPFIEALKK